MPDNLFLMSYSILGGIISFAIVSQVRRWALENHVLDISNERRLHSVPTPRGGGIGIAGATLLFFGIWFGINPGSISQAEIAYIVAAVLIAAMGWLDDNSHLSI